MAGFVTTAQAVDNTWDYSVRVSATVQAAPPSITLTWPQDTNGTPSNYTVSRKAPAATSWSSVASLSGGTTSWTDTTITAGTVYEYRITKAAPGGYTGYGYIQAAVTATLVDQRGKVILLVDNTIASPLANELKTLEQDLAGDGWTVLRRDVSRSDSPANVKSLITGIYNADPQNVKSVFIFGHVPVPYSGQLNPDGHSEHTGAWPADVYYGDVNGNWTDNSIDFVQSSHSDPANNIRLTNRPGDGKFDQTQIPSTVELEVGRVDLANMPGRDDWGIYATFPSEVEALRKYLNKDHNYRHRVVNPTRRAVVGDYLGQLYQQAPAASGYRSFAPIVGPNNVRNLNTEFNDQQNTWIPAITQNDYLFAYGCGYAAYGAISGLGSAGGGNAAPTAEFLKNDVKAVFTMLFGSWH
ncbi:MAG TPA: hypothetical protein VMZ90_14680, partial [Vicinamibacterales bacterium]|nr:hypothetical protein [Vicinamibacterales bacterium]